MSPPKVAQALRFGDLLSRLQTFWDGTSPRPSPIAELYVLYPSLECDRGRMKINVREGDYRAVEDSLGKDWAVDWVRDQAESVVAGRYYRLLEDEGGPFETMMCRP